jgi:hypothetical protein
MLLWFHALGQSDQVTRLSDDLLPSAAPGSIQPVAVAAQVFGKLGDRSPLLSPQAECCPDHGRFVGVEPRHKLSDDVSRELAHVELRHGVVRITLNRAIQARPGIGTTDGSLDRLGRAAAGVGEATRFRLASVSVHPACAVARRLDGSRTLTHGVETVVDHGRGEGDVLAARRIVLVVSGREFDPHLKEAVLQVEVGPLALVQA